MKHGCKSHGAMEGRLVIVRFRIKKAFIGRGDTETLDHSVHNMANAESMGVTSVGCAWENIEAKAKLADPS